MPGPMVSVAVEGQSDTGMVDALLAHVGLALAKRCLVTNGVRNLDKKIPGLAGANIHNPWIVFRDSATHLRQAMVRDDGLRDRST